jgi:hypothetical protein
MSDDMTIKDGCLYGGWRQPVNIWMGAKDSIHNDETARRIGMRGGTIPGTIHLNLFPPLLIKVFGQRWFEQGTLSLYYTFATTDREDVRAVLRLPPEGAKKDVLVEAWVEMPDGHTVAKGTVAMGKPKEPSYLQAAELVNAKPGELRILEGLEAGQALPTEDVLITQDKVDSVLETITDNLDWYHGESPWGKPILPPSMMYGAMMLTPTIRKYQRLPAVGFFGATEIHNINGPIKVGVPYVASGKLICVGASPKTEYFWYDSQLREKASGEVIAEMRHMTRFMKASSPLYLEVKA